MRGDLLESDIVTSVQCFPEQDVCGGREGSLCVPSEVLQASPDDRVEQQVGPTLVFCHALNRTRRCKSVHWAELGVTESDGDVRFVRNARAHTLVHGPRSCTSRAPRSCTFRAHSCTSLTCECTLVLHSCTSQVSPVHMRSPPQGGSAAVHEPGHERGVRTRRVQAEGLGPPPGPRTSGLSFVPQGGTAKRTYGRSFQMLHKLQYADRHPDNHGAVIPR